MEETLPPLPLPAGISSHYVDCPSVSLRIHYLEAGRPASPQDPAAPAPKLLLLLHGYPELAFSWRKLMPALAAAGHHVIAPDQRGHGRTTGWQQHARSWADSRVGTFTSSSLARDTLALVRALGYARVHGVVGHDFGAVVAGVCALVRPDVFGALVLMSHPYRAVGELAEAGAAEGAVGQVRTVQQRSGAAGGRDVGAELAALRPPRMHYRVYNSSQRAAGDWDAPPQGLARFLRGYIHVKSADWARNAPHPLKEMSGEELAKMPLYYIMPQGSTFPQVVTQLMQGEDDTVTTRWLPDEALDVYVQEWQRTGFQGALNWYRAKTEPGYASDLALFVGRKIEVPTKFVSGDKDWGNYQEAGALEAMGDSCTDFRGTVFISHAGHWPQQEQPEQVTRAILDFLSTLND